MSRSKISIASGLIFLLVIVILAFYLITKSDTKFTGTIEDTIQGCRTDSGACKVKVDGKWISTGFGWNASYPQRGKILVPDGSFPMRESIGGQEVIGKKVEVFVKRERDGTLTLYGDENYYIKFLD